MALPLLVAAPLADDFFERLVRDGLITSCREWMPDGNRCNKPAEFILWGKLIDPEALGPRCYDCAAKHVGDRALYDPAWAIADLRRLRAAYIEWEARDA